MFEIWCELSILDCVMVDVVVCYLVVVGELIDDDLEVVLCYVWVVWVWVSRIVVVCEVVGIVVYCCGDWV